jgi:hypothetical protein
LCALLVLAALDRGPWPVGAGDGGSRRMVEVETGVMETLPPLDWRASGNLQHNVFAAFPAGRFGWTNRLPSHSTNGPFSGLQSFGL